MPAFIFTSMPETPVRIGIFQTDETASLSLAGLLAPLQAAQQLLGRARIEINLHPAGIVPTNTQPDYLALLVADTHSLVPTQDVLRQLSQTLQQARYWGAVGSAVLWLANAGKMPGIRCALPWAQYGEVNETAEQAILTPNLFELDRHCITCCGGAASLDFSLTLIHAWFGAEVQAQTMEILCIERVRQGDERQRIALQTRFGVLQPQLSEAVTLMESNMEETLSTDDIAQLVGLSRRQLERQFKQYLGTMPSRYYLELRLKKARQLLLESNSSIVQIGLMCGFSSGAHFSTAFGAQFGMTPREERQRKLSTP